jgi:hypothetical protein
MSAPGFAAENILDVCGRCGNALRPSDNFCQACGAATATPGHQHQPAPFRAAAPAGSPHSAVARGFTQIFGLHPATALLTVAVNVMIFGDAVGSVVTAPVTAGLSLAQLVAVSTTCGGILGGITYLAQKKWYGDDKESAFIKALIVAFLTAIPAGLPSFLVIPSGIVGFFRKKT